MKILSDIQALFYSLHAKKRRLKSVEYLTAKENGFIENSGESHLLLIRILLPVFTVLVMNWF
jgi:hypothetical protein